MLRHGLNVGRSQRLPAGNVGRVVGEVELGVGAAEAEEGGVEGPRRLLRRVVGAQPDALPAVGEAHLGDVFPPLPLPHTLVLQLIVAPLLRRVGGRGGARGRCLHHFQ